MCIWCNLNFLCLLISNKKVQTCIHYDLKLFIVYYCIKQRNMIFLQFSGGVHLPDSTAGRTLVSSWWLFCIIIVGIYSGNLIAYLTVTKEKLPFETLGELIKLKGSYRWGTTSHTHFSAVFLVII